MELSSKLPGVELAQLQSLRQPQRSGQEAGGPQRVELPTREEAGVQVTISPAARAAADALRAQSAEQVGGVAGPVAAETPDPVTAPSRAAASAPTASAAAADTPPPAEAAARGEPAATPAPAQQPDGPTAASSQALQLYLENSARPVGQPGVAPIRASA